MRKINHNQAGAAHIAAVLLLVFLAVAGFIGFKVYTMNSDSNVAQTPTSASTEPDSIKSNSDLTETSKALDKSSSELDASLDDTSLDSDLNALL